jgi:integrase
VEPGVQNRSNPVAMAAQSKREKRTRGEIELFPSGWLRVRVYAGIDPVSKKKLYLTDTVPAGPRQEKLAEQAHTKFLNEVDEKRNPKPVRPSTS